MNRLPLEIYNEIVQFLPHIDIIRLSATCKRLTVPEDVILQKLITEYHSIENLLLVLVQNGYSSLFQKVLKIDVPINKSMIDCENLLTMIKNFWTSSSYKYKGRDHIETVFCYLHIYLKFTQDWDQIIPIMVSTFKYENVNIGDNIYNLVYKFISTDRYTNKEKYDLITQTKGGLLFLLPKKLLYFLFVNSNIFDAQITDILDSLRDSESADYIMSASKITNQQILNYLQTPDKFTYRIIPLLTPSQLDFLRQQSNYIIENFSCYYSEQNLFALIEANVIDLNLANHIHCLYKLLSYRFIVLHLSPNDLAFVKSHSTSIIHDMICNKRIDNLFVLIEQDLIQLNPKSSKKIWNHLIINYDQYRILCFIHKLKTIPPHLLLSVFKILTLYQKYKILTIPSIAKLADKMMLELIYSGFYTPLFGLALTAFNLNLPLLAQILTNSLSFTQQMSGQNDIDTTVIKNSQIILDQLDIDTLSEIFPLLSDHIKRNILTYLLQTKNILYQPLLLFNFDIVLDLSLTIKDRLYLKQIFKTVLPHISPTNYEAIYRHLFNVHPYCKINYSPIDLFQKIRSAL